MTEIPQWWRRPERLQRWVGDFVAGELAQQRPGVALPPRPWPEDLSFGPDGLDIDSLELLELATAFNAALAMHHSGVEDALLIRTSLAGWCEVAAASLEVHAATLTFHSSGTTGAPKAATHAVATLTREISELAEELSGRRRIVAAVPAHHIYGFLFTVLLAAVWDVPVIDVRHRSPAGAGTELQPGDLVVGHPTFWDAFVRVAERLPPDVLGVTSTAPCPAPLAAAVRRCGVERLLQVYGSSETSGIGWRTDPDSPYTLLSFWHRDGDALQREELDGPPTRWVAPDGLVWHDDRYISVGLRRDGVIQVGGRNVDPVAIATVLAEHPAVSAAAVRAMRPEEGRRLKAFIVPLDAGADHARLTAELHGFCQGRLSVAERPKAFSFGERLPAGELGKAADWPLPAPAAAPCQPL